MKFLIVGLMTVGIAASVFIGQTPSGRICPPWAPIVNCFVDPCQFARCPRIPWARCVSDYCGGCFDRWFIGNLEVTRSCRAFVFPIKKYRYFDD